MAAAGAVIGAPSVRTWQNWASGQRRMPGLTWQVWRWCTGLDPWPVASEHQPVNNPSDRNSDGSG